MPPAAVHRHDLLRATGSRSSASGRPRSPSARAQLERARDVGPVHEAVAHAHAPAVARRARSHATRSRERHPRHVAELHRQEHVRARAAPCSASGCAAARAASRRASRSRKTAVPGTRCGGSRSSDFEEAFERHRRRRAGARTGARGRAARSIMTMKIAAPSASGNQPPSSILCSAAAKNVASISMKNAGREQAQPQRIAPADSGSRRR